MLISHETNHCHIAVRVKRLPTSQLKEMRITANHKPIHAVSERRRKPSPGDAVSTVGSVAVRIVQPSVKPVMCEGENDFSNMCISHKKNMNTLRKVTWRGAEGGDNSDGSESRELLIGQLTANVHSFEKAWLTKLNVNGKVISFKLDTDGG